MLNKSRYKDFLLRDFLCDEYFQDWVMHPSQDKDEFWRQWMAMHPEKGPLVVVAKETLLNLDFQVLRPPAGKAEESLQKTLAIIDALEISSPIPEERESVFTIENENFKQDYTKEEDIKTQRTLFSILKPLVIAASVILVLGLVWKLFVAGKPEIPVAQKNKRTADSPLFVLRHEVNTTGKEKQIALADGSIILLANNSELRYREPFGDRRDITLRGKALFKVAKDKRRPFTVSSGDLSTTAIGTEFTVTTFEKTDKVIVRLYEGSIVIKALNGAGKTMKNDVYLLPGQAFIYGGKTPGKVKAFKAGKASAPRDIMRNESALDNPSIQADTGVPWFQFNNQSLEQVLNDLAALYNVAIEYDREDIGNIYFTRKYKRSSTLESILKEIGTLHNLTIAKTEKGYSVTK